MKTVRRILACVLICVTLLSLVPASAASVSLNKKKAKLNVKGLVELSLEGATGAITWYSSDTDIVTVTSAGVCRAKAPGTAKVVAKYNGKKYKCKITVLAPHLNKTEASVDPGKTLKLKLAGATAEAYTSSDTTVATVSSAGKVTGRLPGKTTITATDSAGKKYTCTVTVTGEVCEHCRITDRAVAATCTTTGLTTGIHCSKCRAVLVAQEETPVIPHTYNENGYCTGCGAPDPSKHHIHNLVTIPAKEVTCTTDGQTTKVYCSTCGVVLQYPKTISAKGHNFVNGYCQICGEQYVHTHSVVTVARQEPTCISTGVEAYSYCSTCGEYFVPQKVIPMLGHEYNGGEFCIRCGADYNGHIHKLKKIAEIPATCTNFGYTAAVICELPGCNYEQVPRLTINPTGHYDFNNDGKCDACKITMPQ